MPGSSIKRRFGLDWHCRHARAAAAGVALAMRFYEAEEWIGGQLARVPWRWVGGAMLLAWAGSWAWHWRG